MSMASPKGPSASPAAAPSTTPTSVSPSSKSKEPRAEAVKPISGLIDPDEDEDALDDALDDVLGGEEYDDDAAAEFDFTPAVVPSPLDDVVMPAMLASINTSSYSWISNPASSTGAGPPGTTSPPMRGPRGSLGSNTSGTELSPVATSGSQAAPGSASVPVAKAASVAGTAANAAAAAAATAAVAGGRPAAVRKPSNAYAPHTARRPRFSHGGSGGGGPGGKGRNGSRGRLGGASNPSAEYRAQEKAYVRRIRQDARHVDGEVVRTPSLDYSDGDTGTDEGSLPPTGHAASDAMDDGEMDTLLYYGNDEMQPSVEELKIPENRERLEWHSMLASVLTGDVFKQEKKRIIGGGDQKHDEALKGEIWLGLRARCLGRTVQAQRRLVENARAEINTIVENVISFEIKGEAETGKSAAEQVAEMVQKIETCESSYISLEALKSAHPRVASPEYIAAYDAVIAWHNTMHLIDTELSILRKWVGNQLLNFSQPGKRDGDERLVDESSFVERILKEDGLKSLQNEEGLLAGLGRVINQAKQTLITHAYAFRARHLPPYIEELQTMINFPSRLVKEIITIRLSYAKKIKDLSQQPVMTIEQMIGQFRILLTLAVHIKDAYIRLSLPQQGWDPPDCIEENFDGVVLDALKFYFKLLNWKLSANKNAFKEAEIMEQEWEFSTKVGRYLDGGDVEVAEQFSSLTSKSLLRLNAQFEKELQRKPEEVSSDDIDKRYKTLLDSVRVRQRKLFRFSRLLTQRFENSAEYNINLNQEQRAELYHALALSGHFLVQSSHIAPGFYILASPALQARPQDIQSLLGTCYHAEDNPDDPSNPYILILNPENPLYWPGSIMETQIKQPHLDILTSRLRLVADGSQQRLANAKITFLQATGVDLTVLNEQRANLPRVNSELKKIKRTAFHLSNAIMNSVEIIQTQTAGMDCQELIQACFAFATEFGQRSLNYMDTNRRALNNMRLMRLALDWISFIYDDCIPSDRKTFRWAVTALEFAMIMTQGQNILSMTEGEYGRLRAKVAGCMSLLVSHFDIMGARSTLAAQAEKQRLDALPGKHIMDVSSLRDDEESRTVVRLRWIEQLQDIDELRKQKEIDRAALGRVLEDSNEALRALTYLSSSTSNVHIRWQQGQFIGGGTFGSVYVAINLDTNELMAVKEIRLHDPHLIPTIVAQIRDEMTVLQVLDHPNIVSYYGIEPHRDKVYIFMEYCDGGSLAALLEHGRIEDETVVTVYALQMLEGLAYLHERSVVHRDIKPENILLDHDGVIKFVDFGAAKMIARQGKTIGGGAATGPGGAEPVIVQHQQQKLLPGAAAAGGRQNSMQGTPMYMAPEVIRGSSAGRTGAADVWSLGCVVLEMVTGRRPWASLDNEWAIMYNIAQGNTPQLPVREHMTDAGIAFLARCFERDSARRASAVELLQDPWIVEIRAQLALEPATPASEGSVGSALASRQNSMT